MSGCRVACTASKGTDVARRALSRSAMAAATTNLRDRERFDALRRQMFREMALAGKRWGLMWWGTIGIIVLAAMTVYGASPARFALQIGAVALAVPSLVHRVRHPG